MKQVHVTHPEEVPFRLLINPAKKGMRAAEEVATWYTAAADVFDLLRIGITSGHLQAAEHKIASLAEICGYAFHQLAETQGEELQRMARDMGYALEAHEERKQAEKGGTS